MTEHENWVRISCLEIAQKQTEHRKHRSLRGLLNDAKELERYALNIPSGEVLNLATSKKDKS